MSNILVVVDVQKEFNEFIQHDLVDGIFKYAKKFDSVYQIWDTHDGAVIPTHTFPGQVDSIPKKFGENHFSDSIKAFIKKVEDTSEEGRTFKLEDEEGYLVRVKNNHDWFYVNPEIVELISKIKNETVILVGGATDECLEDIYQTFLAFGINVQINKKYTFNAKTTSNDTILVKESIEPEINEIVILINDIYELNTINKIDGVNDNNTIDISSQTTLPTLLFLNFNSKNWSYIGNNDNEFNNILNGNYNHEVLNDV